MPDNADEYRRHARESLEAADRMHNEEDRKILLHIAQTWQQFADREEETSRAEKQQQARPDEKKE
jgi:hypothetical protein